MFKSPSDTYPPITPQREIYTVSQLNQEVRLLLSSSFPLIWVEGELSNLARPASGHLYFTLKDEQAQVRCAMFKNRNLALRLKPENGMHVLVRSRVGLYERRGEFQLTVEHMEKAGSGALQRAFEALKQKLAAEGLFDSSRKKPLPNFPRQLGIITSPSGAAIRDILSILHRRYPALPVLIYPVPVQGEEAAGAIAQALYDADRRRECDALILARGGGSMEDLWAFNEEVVARAIAACDIPVVSGIGHEIDFTIADFVADLRAPTPSAAAELVSPNRHALMSTLTQLDQLLNQHIQSRLSTLRQKLVWLQVRLTQQHPQHRLQQQNQRLDELERILRHAMGLKIKSLINQINVLSSQLQKCSPAMPLVKSQARHSHLHERLFTAACSLLENRTHRLETLAHTLHSISPLATLSRGYAIVTRQTDGTVVRTRKNVTLGSKVQIRLVEDRLSAEITELE